MLATDHKISNWWKTGRSEKTVQPDNIDSKKTIITIWLTGKIYRILFSWLRDNPFLALVFYLLRPPPFLTSKFSFFLEPVEIHTIMSCIKPMIFELFGFNGSLMLFPPKKITLFDRKFGGTKHSGNHSSKVLKSSDRVIESHAMAMKVCEDELSLDL